MAKYSVIIPWYCSVTINVEAETKEAALKKAVEQAHPSLCHHCSREIEMGDMVDHADIEVYPV